MWAASKGFDSAPLSQVDEFDLDAESSAESACSVPAQVSPNHWGLRLKKSARIVVGLVTLTALIAAGMQVSKKPTPEAASRSASMDAVSLHSLTPSEESWAQYVCKKHHGILHTMGRKCCAEACGDYCGHRTCHNGPGGEKACCRFQVADCSETQDAPCMVTMTTTTTTTTSTTSTTAITHLTGSMVIATQADEGSVKEGVPKALAAFFGIPEETISAQAVKMRRLADQDVVQLVMYTVGFQIDVPDYLYQSILPKVNEMKTDHDDIVKDLDVWLGTKVSLTVFTINPPEA
jgi:hypothetical protein